MKCTNTINNIDIWAILITIVGDALGLVAELLNQRDERKSEREQEKKDLTKNLIISAYELLY